MKAYLQRLNPSSQELWYYVIQIQRDLFGRWHVIREWGRFGSPGTLRQTPYDHFEKAVEGFQNIKNRLIQKDYQVVMQEGLKPAMTSYITPSQEKIPSS